MEKLCVFCGERPKSKSSEHVIPQWLIELTGNPKRIAMFGYKNWLKPSLGKRLFSFDSFRFPSCTNCNNSFSKLEETTKQIVSKILSNDSISAPELHTLLDWFDKIRIGLWLSYQYLDKNPLGITPKFYVKRRIGAHDRMLAIFKTDGANKGINMIGCDMLSFYYTPSCFALRINNFIFFNISYDNLFSRRIGFPYPIETFMIEDDQIENEPISYSRFTSGRNRVMKPLLKKRLSIQTTEIYQPMYSQFICYTHIKKFYDTQYVRANSISWEKGIGKVFIKDNTSLKEYPVSPSKIWAPKRTYSFDDLLFEIQLLTLEWQSYLDSISPSLKLLSKERRKQVLQSLQIRKEFNNKMIDMIKTKAKEV